MEKKYVLILGAGLMQKPSLEAAKELGFTTVVVDGNPGALCVPFADRFEHIDLKNTEGIAELARSLGKNLAGVFTAGTDFSAAVSYAASKCGLPCHPYEAALNASNKILMRKCFLKEGVGSPSFMEIHRSQAAQLLSSEWKEKIHYPCVAKPVDNMGARGCRMVRNSAELIPAVEEAVRASRCGKVILEEYMEGPEFSIDAIIYNGTLTITGFADRHIFFPPYFIETGHTMQTVIDEEKRNELIACFARGIKSLGLTTGVAKADIKYTAKGPMIGEIAARLSGGYMSGWTYPYASGLNLTKTAMKIATGIEPDELISGRVRLDIKNVPFDVYEYKVSATSAERAWISIPGKIKSIYGYENAKNNLFVKCCFPRVKEGDKVDFPRNNVEKCGNIITLSSDYNLAVKSAEDAVSDIVIRLEADNPETENYLSKKEKRAEKGFPYSAFNIEDSLYAKIKYWCRKNVRFKNNIPVYEQIPESIIETAGEVKDFNHRTLEKSIRLFDLYGNKNYCFTTDEFFTAMFRGGIQGVLYLSDCRSVKK